MYTNTQVSSAQEVFRLSIGSLVLSCLLAFNRLYFTFLTIEQKHKQTEENNNDVAVKFLFWY